MRVRWISVLLSVALAGCSTLTDSRKASVYFEPYSAELDASALESIHAAASFAKDHPLQPVAVVGYAAPPDPGRDVAGLSAERAENVKQALVSSGIPSERITTEANGIVDPKNMPSVAVRRVDINVGQ